MVHPRLILPLALALLAPACGPKQAPPPQPPAPEPEPEPVDPIPEGFFTLTPQLVVPDVDKAIEFYGNAFGAAKAYSMAGPDGSTMHAEIKIGDSVLMLDKENVDEGMKSPITLGGTPATLMMYVDDADATYQAAMDAGARAWTPVEETFWGDRYGELEDPFGHRWALATHVEDLTPEQMQQRAELAMPTDPKVIKKAKKAKKKGDPPLWKEVAGAPAADPTPDDYHTVTLSLITSDANAAIEYYKAAFGAAEKDRMPTPEGKVAHAELTFGDSVLMLSDERPDMGYQSAASLGGSPISVHMYTTDANAAFTQATGAGGTEAMAMADTFWGDRYGVVVDVAGFSWGVATHIEDVPPEQMEERMKAAMAAKGGGGEAAPAEGGEAAPAEGGDAPAEAADAPAS